MLSGEYWLKPGGRVQEADRESHGQYGHDVHACIEARASIQELLGLGRSVEYSEGPDDWNAWLENTAAAIGGDTSNPYNSLEDAGVPDPLISASRGGPSASEYAITAWGWVRVHGCNIETASVAPDKLRQIARAIERAAEMEGRQIGEASVFHLDIHGRAGKATLAQMHGGRLGSRPAKLPAPEWFPPVAIAHDRAAVHPCYHGEIGG